MEVLSVRSRKINILHDIKGIPAHQATCHTVAVPFWRSVEVLPRESGIIGRGYWVAELAEAIAPKCLLNPVFRGECLRRKAI